MGATFLALGDGTIRRVAVLRALQLGDLLCAVPALRALRAALPGAEIVLVGLPWARGFVDAVRALPRRIPRVPGLPRPARAGPELDRIPAFLAAMQAERFDLAIQLHGSGPFVNPLIVLFGARRSAGFFLPGDYCPDPETFLPWPGSRPGDPPPAGADGVPRRAAPAASSWNSRSATPIFARFVAIDEACDLVAERLCVHPSRGECPRAALVGRAVRRRRPGAARPRACASC